MKVFVALSALLCAAVAAPLHPATAVLRAPSHDSAVIQSHRFGGNFAYRTDEAHAYAAISPIVSTVRRPVGVSFHHGAPIVKSTTVEHSAPIEVASYATPIAYNAPTLAYSATPAIAYSGLHGYAGLAPAAYGLGLHGYHGLGLGLPLSIEKAEEVAVEAAE